MLDLLKKIAAGDGQDEVIDDVLELIERAECVSKAIAASASIDSGCLAA